MRTHALDAVYVTKVGQEKTEKEYSPDAQVGGGAQHQGLIQSKDGIHVGKLRQNDTFPDGWAEDRGRGRSICQSEIFLLLKVCIIGTYCSGDRLNV